ncbi:MAG: alternative ribosome rescue aminoacyl-tRNA hydrolase ArfB [Planctomycetota bacterium]|jgi:ribosome-associated protein
MEPLTINRKLSIPESDLTFTFSRSSGPGGQNVNKLNTRVTVSLNIDKCEAFTDGQRARVRHVLKSRIDKEGNLNLSCQEYRSQHANRNAVLERLAELIAKALKPVKKRRPTKPTKGSIERRLQSKQKRSQLKKLRGKPVDH